MEDEYFEEGIFIFDKPMRPALEEDEIERDEVLDDLEILEESVRIAKTMGDHRLAGDLEKLRERFEKHSCIYEVTGKDAMDVRQNIVVPALNVETAIDTFCHFYGVSKDNGRVSAWLAPEIKSLVVMPFVPEPFKQKKEYLEMLHPEEVTFNEEDHEKLIEQSLSEQ